MADQPAAAPLMVETVLSTLLAALSHDTNVRQPAEDMLRQWETQSTPGFIAALMRVAEQHTAVDEPTRLMAVVLAKNSVGSNWRKTLGSREWVRVPAAEQAAVRGGVLQLLLTEPSDRVGLQLGLLAANICAFDFPSAWPEVLQQLLGAAHWGSPYAPQFRLRALRSLKFIFRGLTNKRFVAEPIRGPEGMAAITARMHEERMLYRAKLTQAVAPLHQLVAAHLPEFLKAAQDWHMHGLFAKAAVNGVCELYYLIGSREALPDNSRPLLEGLHAAFAVLVSGSPQGAPPGGGPAQQGAGGGGGLDGAGLERWQELGGRLHERISRAIISHLDNFPIPFAEYVPYFLQLFVEVALVRLDAAALRTMRPKRRVLLVRFLAKALLCPYYRAEWLEVNQSSEGPAVAQVAAAYEALAALLSPAQASPLVEALASKYVALTDEELQEWQDDPEGYIRSMDVESGPDADTPRPVGVGLLLCMLERGGEAVAQALLGLAGRLQQAGEGQREAVLLREAVYRCIGEGWAHLAPYLTFASWYGAELSGMLRSRLQLFMEGGADIIMSVLQARALWLVGACGGELPREQWVDAWGLSVSHMGCSDLVVALMAVQAVLLLAVQLLDDQALLEQAKSAQLASQKAAQDPAAAMMCGGAAAVDAALTAAETGFDEETLAEATLRSQWRLDALTGRLPELLHNAFTLLGRLSEVESSVRVLQLISVIAEAAGDQLQPHLGAVAQSLPQVWESASAQRTQQEAAAAAAATLGRTKASSADSGSLARLHSALMAVLTHLVGKLRGPALDNPQVQAVLYPLLNYATDLRGPEGEVLVEEAFKLWAVTLSACSTVPQPLLSLLPNMAILLRRGKDNTAAFQMLESYLLLGAGAALQPYGDVIAGAVTRAVHGVCEAVKTSMQGLQQPPAAGSGAPGAAPAAAAAGGVRLLGAGGGRGPGGQQQHMMGMISTEASQEGLAAAGLMDVMLQLHPGDAPALLLEPFRSMAGLVGGGALGGAGGRVPSKVVNILEAFLEVLARLFLSSPEAYPSLLAGAGPEAPPHFLDTWLTTAGAQVLEELMGVGHMAMLGRFRRRIGAAALCRLLAAGVLVPGVLLSVPSRMARFVALLVKVAGELEAFAGDVHRLDTMDFAAELGSDYVLARRLQVAKSDPVRQLNIPEIFQACLSQLAAAAGGEEAMLAAASQHLSAHVQRQAAALLHGRFGSAQPGGSPGP